MRPLIALLLTALLLTACNTPKAPLASPTPRQDFVATEVAMMLTSTPREATPTSTATLAPSETPTPNGPTAVVITPTDTAQPVTDTPAAPTMTFTATLPSGDPKTSLGDPTWQTAFTKNVGFGLYDNGHTKVSQESGALDLSAADPNGWLGWTLTFSQKPKDFYLEATFETQSCSGKDMYGLIFRTPNTSDGGYLYGFTCDGHYSLRSADFKNNNVVDLVKLASTDKIQSGSNQTNRMGVLVKGDQISLYVNGNLLTQVNDATFADEGYFGAFIAAYETAGFTVKMSQISLWNLS